MLTFDTLNAYKYASAIAKPRRTGSSGEAETAAYITNTLKGFGLNVYEEYFTFPIILREFLKAPILVTLFMLFILFFLFHINSSLLAVSAALTLALLLSFVTGIPFVALLKCIFSMNIPFINKKLGSKNIIASLGNDGRSKRSDIYILSHYDSKSQSLSIVYRIILISISFLCSIYVSIQYIIWALMGGAHSSWIYVIYSLILFSGMLLLLMSEGNSSPGAIDNAAGVGVLLHLAEILSKERSRFKDVNIMFVATGAEEEGLVGAFHLCRSLVENSISKESTYFINLDGIGVKGDMYCSHKIGLHLPFTDGQHDFVELIKKAGNDSGINIRFPPFVIGAAADHFPFVYEGFNAVTLSTVSRKSLIIHTRKDDIDRIDLEGLEITERLILNVIDLINTIYGNKHKK